MSTGVTTVTVDPQYSINVTHHSTYRLSGAGYSFICSTSLFAGRIHLYYGTVDTGDLCRDLWYVSF